MKKHSWPFSCCTARFILLRNVLACFGSRSLSHTHYYTRLLPDARKGCFHPKKRAKKVPMMGRLFIIRRSEPFIRPRQPQCICGVHIVPPPVFPPLRCCDFFHGWCRYFSEFCLCFHLLCAIWCPVIYKICLPVSIYGEHPPGQEAPSPPCFSLSLSSVK